MVRTTKLAVAAVVILLSAGIVLGYTGNAEPYVSQSDLPGEPAYGFVAVFVLALGGATVAGYLDSRAWRRMGRKAGLPPDGRISLFPNPDGGNRQLLGVPHLTGTVQGRSVRARTYTTGGGRNRSSKTYTVVEADLETPVQWSAMFGVATGDWGQGIDGLDAMESNTIDGEFTVWGEIPEDLARDLLTPAVRDALRTLDDGVSVGDIREATAGAMLDSIPEDSGSVSHKLARGMLGAAMDGDGDSPSTVVVNKQRGLLTDPDELERRVAAVVALAESVERLHHQTVP